MSRIDLGRAFELLADASPAPLLAALGILLAATAALAGRWQLLLASASLTEPLGWLTKIYFVSQAVGQLLPTALGMRGELRRQYA